MIFYEIVGRKTAKKIAGSSVGLRQNKNWTQKKKLQAEEEPVM
jgi:hypothetical protein